MLAFTTRWQFDVKLSGRSVHRLHRGEQQDVADGGVVRHEHDHAVDADAQAAGGGHAVLQGVCWAFGPAGGVDGVGQEKCWKAIPFNAKWCSFGVGLV